MCTTHWPQQRSFNKDENHPPTPAAVAGADGCDVDDCDANPGTGGGAGAGAGAGAGLQQHMSPPPVAPTTSRSRQIMRAHMSPVRTRRSRAVPKRYTPGII